jgi:deoxycytidylate deaminase
MSCAKKHVTCVLVTPYGEKFVGTNKCLAPQDHCPREPWEGYEKCTTICRQVGHAEEVALLEAKEKAKGARAFIHGIGHVCRVCQEKLFGAGVISFSIIQNLNELEEK